MDTLFEVEKIDVMHNEYTCHDCIYRGGWMLNEYSKK